MIDCKQATYLISKTEEKGKVSWRMRLELSFHMFLCKYCSAFMKNSKLISKVIARTSSIELTQAEKQEMDKALKNQAED